MFLSVSLQTLLQVIYDRETSDRTWKPDLDKALCSVVSGLQGKPLSLGRELAAYPKGKRHRHCLPPWEVAGSDGGVGLGCGHRG